MAPAVSPSTGALAPGGFRRLTALLPYSILYLAVSVFWVIVFARLGGRVRQGTLWRVFFFGMASGPLAGLLSHLIQKSTLPGGRGLFDTTLNEFFLYFLVVGPVEEGLKFFAVVLGALRRPDFRSSADGILLGIAAALGFAGGENVLYLMAFGLPDTLPRLFLGNLGHAAYSVFWAYALGAVLHENAPFSLILTGLALAALAHGAYNFFLTRSIFGAMIAFGLSGLLFWFLFAFFRAEIKRRGTR